MILSLAPPPSGRVRRPCSVLSGFRSVSLWLIYLLGVRSLLDLSSHAEAGRRFAPGLTELDSACQKPQRSPRVRISGATTSTVQDQPPQKTDYAVPSGPIRERGSCSDALRQARTSPEDP